MLLKKLKDFHERTMEQYREEENMEPWKKKVMEIHEKSEFLFYYDATLEENISQASLIVQGSVTEGELPIGTRVYLYTGEGRYLGNGTVLTEPEEKEQGRKGLLKRRRNEFSLKINEYLGKETEKMNAGEKTKMMRHFESQVSLISEILICGDGNRRRYKGSYSRIARSNIEQRD